MSYATIDVGTNTLLLLIAKPKGKTGVTVVAEDHEITRLGQGLADNHFLLPQAMDRTFLVLKRFLALCEKHKVKKVFAVGTAACRVAANTGVFLGRVKKELGLSIQVLTSKEEAQFTFQACYQDSKQTKKPLIVVDIGGGSTEIITGPKNSKSVQPQTIISLDMGSVKITEDLVYEDPISPKEYEHLWSTIKQNVADELDGFYPTTFSPENSLMIATAGTATTLCALDQKMKAYKKDKIQGATLTKDRLSVLINTLAKLTVHQRQELPGMEPLRADVILAGALLLKALMEYFKQESTRISDRGLRYGVFFEKFLK